MRMDKRHAGICAVAIVAASGAAMASPLIIAGPEWNGTTNNGYSLQNIPGPGRSVSNGFGVAYADKIVNGSDKGVRGLRLTESGPVELGTLGTNSSGNTSCYVTEMSAGGVIIGYARRYVGNSNTGMRAVRWDAGSNTATQLADLGTGGSGFTNSYARGVNEAGTVVGEAVKYVSFQDRGDRAVRWNAGSTAATELGHLGLDFNGNTNSVANAINESGLVVGDASRWGPGNPGGGDDGPPGTTGYLGQRAVRWNPGSTIAIQLAHLGSNNLGVTSALAYGVNNAGVTFGWANKFGSGGAVDQGRRAVRWDAGVTAATELGVLGTSLTGYTLADAWDINEPGDIVGATREYNAAGTQIGTSAVRWAASTIEAVALGRLGSNANGGTDSGAWSITDSGWIAGDCHEFSPSGADLGQRAVVWTPQGEPIALNGYLDAGNLWLNLYSARGISESGWVSGIGLYDADGAGAEPAYYRVFVMRVPAINPCFGDANHDRSINFSDISPVLANWGFVGSPFRTGDADGNSAVDFGDVSQILANFGLSCP